MKIPALLFVVVVVLTSNGQGVEAVKQHLQAYDYADQTGTSVWLEDYEESLSNQNFNDRTTSYCLTGIWFLYSEEFYNHDGYGSMHWGYGDNNCIELEDSSLNNRASSARFAGLSDDWKADHMSYYTEEWFMGWKEGLVTDSPFIQFTNGAKSLVVSGCTPWTLYEDRHYIGDCMCVYPSSSACTPGMYKDESSLGYMAGRVMSVRKGCYCNNKVYPDNHGSTEQQGFF